MKYGSVCSGIEAATVAWGPLGWEPAFFSEIEKFPRAVLSHHYPDVPLHGDFTTIQDGDYDTIDVMVGGTPCQDFSVAGLRAGFGGDQGNLTTEFVFLTARLRPRWFVFENVPGILSSDKGRGFAEFLGQLTGTTIQRPKRGWKKNGIATGHKNAYGVAWRVLDAQYVRTHSHPGAVPQRRRRVFLVGYLGDWRRAAAVLLDSESLPGNPAPGRKKREVSPIIPARSSAGGGLGADFDCDGGLIKTGTSMGDNQPAVCNPVSPSVTASGPPFSRTGNERVECEAIVANTLTRRMHKGVNTTVDEGQTIVRDMQVRRLTPTECERLQGFPDSYTKIPWRGKPPENCPDGPRYKALGNSMAVNCMEWIGRRINKIDGGRKTMKLGAYNIEPGHTDSYPSIHLTANGEQFTAIPDYKFAGTKTPRKHQVETWGFFLKHPKCFCLDGLGLGKTLSAIWAMDYLLKTEQVRRILIVAPLSICSYVWERELFQTLPHYPAVVPRGDRHKKQKLAGDSRYRVMIINPESLHIIQTPEDLDLIIVDEFTKFKNSRSRRYKALRSHAKNTRLWLMSGTPTPQSPLDAYAPIKLVRQDKLSFLQWRDWTMLKVSEFTWVPRSEAEPVIAKWMQPAIRHKVQDCVDLPSLTVNNIEVDLTKAQHEAVQGFMAKAKAEVDGDSITATTAAAVLSKCLQVMGGGVYDAEKDIKYIDAKPFYEAVVDTVEQADTPVLIFVPFRSTAQAVYDAVKKTGYHTGLITGDVKTADRDQLFTRVQNGSLDALVAVAGTMSHGLTLTTARYILWACPPYSYEEYEQANGRIYRDGQKNPVIIYHLVQNKMAADLFTRLKSKEKLQNTVLRLIQDTENYT